MKIAKTPLDTQQAQRYNPQMTQNQITIDIPENMTEEWATTLIEETFANKPSEEFKNFIDSLTLPWSINDQKRVVDYEKNIVNSTDAVRLMQRAPELLRELVHLRKVYARDTGKDMSHNGFSAVAILKATPKLVASSIIFGSQAVE